MVTKRKEDIISQNIQISLVKWHHEKFEEMFQYVCVCQWLNKIFKWLRVSKKKNIEKAVRLIQVKYKRWQPVYKHVYLLENVQVLMNKLRLYPNNLEAVLSLFLTICSHVAINLFVLPHWSIKLTCLFKWLDQSESRIFVYMWHRSAVTNVLYLRGFSLFFESFYQFSLNWQFVLEFALQWKSDLHLDFSFFSIFEFRLMQSKQQRVQLDRVTWRKGGADTCVS